MTLIERLWRWWYVGRFGYTTVHYRDADNVWHSWRVPKVVADRVEVGDTTMHYKQNYVKHTEE